MESAANDILYVMVAAFLHVEQANDECIRALDPVYSI